MAAIHKTPTPHNKPELNQAEVDAQELLEGTVESEDLVRLDRYIADTLKALTRSQLKSRLVAAIVNGREVKLSRLVRTGDLFSLKLAAEESRVATAENLDLSVIYEDDSVIVVDKPQGMVTHPAHGNWQGTLANGLLGRFSASKRFGEPAGQHAARPAAPLAPTRAGIVHRLDKDTSGIIIAAKNVAAQEFLASQFRDRSTSKLYYAIVKGRDRKSTRLNSSH